MQNYCIENRLSFVHSYQKQVYFSPADAYSPGENELRLCHLSYFAKTRFQLGFSLKTKTNLSHLSNSVPWNTNKKLFIQGSLFEVTQLPTSTLKAWETTQVPLSLKVTIPIFLVAIKLLRYFHELSPTFNKTWVQGAQFASLNLPRFLWRKEVQGKSGNSKHCFNILLTYVLRFWLWVLSLRGVADLKSQINFAFIFIPRTIISQVLKIAQDCDSSSLRTSVFLYATQSITTFILSSVPSNPLMHSLIYLLLMYIAVGFPRCC